jgi:hydroxypyruvate reductase
MPSQAARKIFAETLLRIDAESAVRRMVKIDGSHLLVGADEFELGAIYVAAIGKAAYQMAVGFDKAASKFIKAGVVSGVFPERSDHKLNSKWKCFAGGHPLPNEASLDAGKACLDLLALAEAEKAFVVFLISGGGSAMMDVPVDPAIGLSELREMNDVLVKSGAEIGEINSIRRAVSSVKGGKLALKAPSSKQISLVISDTSAGDVSSVASGPSIQPDKNIPDPLEVVGKYRFDEKLPPSIVKAISDAAKLEPIETHIDGRIYILLDNEFMIGQAMEVAESLGLSVEIDKTAGDLPIDEGCKKLYSRLAEFRASVDAKHTVCLISGGEFGCTVKGSGLGGRNSETVLRLALLAKNGPLSGSEYAILSAGTDGIDGNSPAAGAVLDNSGIERAMEQGLDPQRYLDNSDSFSFFDSIGDAIITGPTGTNVRDIRILIAG